MVADAESHAEEDKLQRELIEAKNQAEALIHSTEKTLEEYSDKVSESDKSVIVDAIDELKKSILSENIVEISQSTETLTQASMKLGEAMYKEQQNDSESTLDENNESFDGDDVMDADFEEIKDNKDEE
jgi:molecular chaperone DnaK